MSRWYEPTPLNRMLEHVEVLGLGHRPDVDVVGKHYSTCPVCGREDALTIFEPDEGLPVKFWCRARCHADRVEQALGVVPGDEARAPCRTSPDDWPPDPALLRRQVQLLIAAPDFLERQDPEELRAVV
jgi:hypothetical protein